MNQLILPAGAALVVWYLTKNPLYALLAGGGVFLLSKPSAVPIAGGGQIPYELQKIGVVADTAQTTVSPSFEGGGPIVDVLPSQKVGRQTAPDAKAAPSTSVDQSTLTTGGVTDEFSRAFFTARDQAEWEQEQNEPWEG